MILYQKYNINLFFNLSFFFIFKKLYKKITQKNCIFKIEKNNHLYNLNIRDNLLFFLKIGKILSIFIF